ncbi:MAG: glycosyltransferase family 2 protein [Candidatus Levyibacteriota bacterium]
MISAVILTKNEGKNIIDCIKNLSFANEIIIIDDNSNDKTAELVESLKRKEIKIFKRDLQKDFGTQRNFGLSKATGEWVIFIDADERVSDALAWEVSNLNLNNLNGFFVRRIDVMWGKRLQHGEIGNINLLRMAKKDAGAWEGKVHEKWNVKGRIGSFKNPLMHYPHQSVSEFLKEINFYTDIRAKELHDKKVKAGILSIILYPMMKFIVNYFFKLGFFDGLEGLVFAMMMSFHSFLVRGKLWQLSF